MNRSGAYRMRLVTGVICALPIAIGSLWYGWSAYATLDRYRRASDPSQALTSELFQIALHDELSRDLRRLALPERPEHGRLPTYELSLTRDAVDQLARCEGSGEEGSASYVNALIKKDDEVHQARVRCRGGQPWHYLGAQKSLKVRLDRGELLDGTRAFNFINDATPLGLEDQIILDLARESGLLTPEYRPVWLRYNNTELGVFRYESQPDEGLLRRSGRMPGNMYSGDSDAGPVFFEPKAWKKVAYASEETKDDQRELERLLQVIGHSDQVVFNYYAARQIDLGRYAAFDALDVVFGGSEHDWLSNHKLYVDPYTGKFEPVAWSFRGFQHEPALNLVDNPLLIRLKLVPGFIAQRDRAVYALLTDKASVPAVRARIDQIFTQLAPELEADPWWDAYKLLPRSSRFARFMTRPMSLDRWALAAELELAGYNERSRYLLNVLEEPGVHLLTQRLVPEMVRIDLTLDGEAAYVVRKISLSGPTCDGREIQLWADTDLNGVFDGTRDHEVGRLRAGSSVSLSGYRALSAGLALVARADASKKRGPVRVELEPRVYSYFGVAAHCALDAGAIELDNLVTGGSTRLLIAVPATPIQAEPRSHDLRLAIAPVVFEAGQRSAHVWTLPQPEEPVSVPIGPGRVEILHSARYGAHQRVHILPGTTLALGSQVSLIFEGPLWAEGPIQIERADKGQAFGGLALQGPGTAGSRLSGLSMRGGSRVRDDVIAYSGLLNLHDSSDITLEGVSLEADEGSEDVLHANAVTGLVLHEVSVRGAPVDGIDLELSQAELRGVRVLGAGDDCLDVGGSVVHVRDSVLVRCTHNGVSAGERTQLTLHSSLIAGAETGVLAKNGSEVRATRSLIWQADVALRTNFRELYYADRSAIGASELYAVGCDELRKVAKGTLIDAGALQTTLPEPGALPHLLNVLGLASWTELEAEITRMDPGAQP